MASSKQQKSSRPDNPYGNRPRLEPDDFQGKNAYIAVIETAEWVNVAKAEEAEQGVADYKLVLTYDKFPGRQHVINKTGFKSLSAKLPAIEKGENEAERWVGEAVALVIANTNNPRTGEPREVVWVASPKQWDQIMSKTRGRK